MIQFLFSLFLHFGSSPPSLFLIVPLFPLSLSFSLVLKDLCICLYCCVYWCKCLRSTTTVICFLEVAEGRQRVCICVGAMQNYYYYFFLLKQRMQELESSFQNESLTTKNALSISLYLIGCITGSMSHQPLYHCCSKYQVKAFAVSFSKDLCTVYKYI